jgi:hypothetical protein
VFADSISLTRSTDGACTWPSATGAVTGQVIDDVFSDPNDPSFLLAIVTVLAAAMWSPRTTAGPRSIRRSCSTSAQQGIC